MSLEMIGLALAAAAVVVAITSTRLCFRLKRELTQLRELHSQSGQDLRDDIKVLYKSAGGMGDKLKRLERTVRSLEERQNQLSLSAPGEQVYAQAARMLARGVELEEVVGASGLSRGEVELLRLLKQRDRVPMD